MKKYVILTIIGILILIVITFGLTYAFMMPKEENENETQISIKACAKIVFKEKESTIIDLENTYPMDDEMGLETKPYEFSISSTCEEYVGFNLYLTSLEDNTLADENIKYAITDVNNNVLASANLTEAIDGISDFDEEELNQLEKGIKGEKKSIYKVYNNNISKADTSNYKLYLWVDSKTNNDTMDSTFKVGVSVKSYGREESGAEKLIATVDKDETLYYHDKNLIGGAEDNSYRFSGATDKVNNFVCLDGGVTTEGKCANDDADLYRIIGLFKNELNIYEMKLIKYDYATITQLGNIGAIGGSYGGIKDYYKGTSDLNNINGYHWTSKDNQVNEWAGSALRKTNLNDYYLNTYLKTTKNIDVDNLITTHTWSLNGHSTYSVTPKVMYDNEMNKVESSPSYPTVIKTINDKIGLLYISDYGYAAIPSSVSNWTKNMRDNSYDSNNWMYMGLSEWLISRSSSNSSYSFNIASAGGLDINQVFFSRNVVRPCFYISSNVQIKSGEGTYEYPYRLEI